MAIIPSAAPLFGQYDPRMIQDVNNEDIDEALACITEALPGYEMAKEYDDINRWEYYGNSRESRTLRQSDLEFDPNFCGVVIDSVSNRMEMLSRTVTSGEVGDDEQSDAVTAILDRIWDENELENYYREWDRNALRDGDGYIMVWPDEEYGEIDANYNVNITYVDPRMGRMFYDSENPRKKTYFAMMWEAKIPGERDTRIRLNLYYPDRIEKYIAKDKAARRRQDFIPFDDGSEEWPVLNPFGEVPAFHLRTSHAYGKPEHRNAFAAQDAITRLIEMMMVTVEFQGYPQRYAIQQADSLGTQTMQEDPLASASANTDDQDEFANYHLNTVSETASFDNETGSGFEASPGSMQLYKNFQEVGSWTTADPNVFLDPMREMARTISSTTDTPLHKFAGFGGTPPSGESLRIIEAPLNKKVRDRDRLFGSTWSKALEFALRVAGYSGRVVITWENPETTDMMDVWQLVRTKIELGVPMEVALMQAGVPEHQAAEWAELKAQREEEAKALQQMSLEGADAGPKAPTDPAARTSPLTKSGKHTGAAVSTTLYDAIGAYAKQNNMNRGDAVRLALSRLTGVSDDRRGEQSGNN